MSAEEQDRRIALLEAELRLLQSAPPPPASTSLRGHHLPKFNGKDAADAKTWMHQVDLSITAAGETRQSKIIANVGMALEEDAASWFRVGCESGQDNLGGPQAGPPPPVRPCR